MFHRDELEYIFRVSLHADKQSSILFLVAWEIFLEMLHDLIKDLLVWIQSHMFSTLKEDERHFYI